MKKVLITGCAGFIGFHLARELLKKNINILGIDNFNDYYSPFLKKERVKVLAEGHAQVLNIDLCDLQALKKVVFDYNPTHIVHLAAQAGVRYSLKNPLAYVQSNLVGFTHLLEILKEKPKIKTVYASSSSVYGDNQKVPFSEYDVADCPKNLYGSTKKANEVMAYAYHSLYNLSLIGMRFFTVYGPWGRPDMAYYLFSEKILKGEPIDVYEGASIKRDFTYIDDIVNGLIASLDLEEGYDIFNLGNNSPVLLNEFIHLLEKALGKKAVKNYLPQAKGDMEVTYADISKAKKLLNFQPTTDLETGLRHFANWFLKFQEQNPIQLQQQLQEQPSK